MYFLRLGCLFSVLLVTSMWCNILTYMTRLVVTFIHMFRESPCSSVSFRLILLLLAPPIFMMHVFVPAKILMPWGVVHVVYLCNYDVIMKCNYILIVYVHVCRSIVLALHTLCPALYLRKYLTWFSNIMCNNKHVEMDFHHCM